MDERKLSVDWRAVVERMKGAANVRTDAELAAVLGISKGSTHDWRKEGVPSKHLVTITQRFGAPISLLLTGSVGDPDQVLGDLRPVAERAALLVAGRHILTQRAIAQGFIRIFRESCWKHGVNI